MVLDKEEHRAVLLEVISHAHFPGRFAEDVAELKKAITEASTTEKADTSE